jgi:hypothetical protein
VVVIALLATAVVALAAAVAVLTTVSEFELCSFGDHSRRSISDFTLVFCAQISFPLVCLFTVMLLHTLLSASL